MVDCFVCRTALPVKRDRRRVQSSDSVYKQLQNQLEAIDKEVNVPPEAIVCRPCMRRLEKLSKLYSDYRSSECDIQSQLRVTAALLPKSQRAVPSPSTTVIGRNRSPQKRPLEVEASTPTRKRKRQRIITPVRNVIARTVVQNSPGVSVVVCRKNSSTVHNLTSSMKKLGKSIGRSRPIGIARQVMSHKRTRAAVLREIGLLMRREMRSLCSKKTPSVLRRKVTVELLKGFRWKDVSNELRERSPVLYQILKEVLQRKRRKTKGNKPSIQVDDDLIASLCAGVILRHRNSRMSLVQRIISLLLYSEHTTKLTYRRLQRLRLCLSHPAIISTVDLLGEHHDARVHAWREELQHILSANEGVSDPVLRDNQTEQQTVHRPSTGTENKIEASLTIDNLSRNVPSAGADDTVQQSFDDFVENPFPESASMDWDESDGTNKSSTTESESSGTDTDYGTCASSVSTTATSSASSFIPVVTTTQLPVTPLPTFKIVGDNINKYVKPSASEMTIDAQAKTLDFFNLYAVHDRVSMSGLDDSVSLPSLSSCQVQDVLPTEQDHRVLVENFAYLIARVLKKYVPFFTTFGSGLQKHLKHQYYSEMAQKSEVVPLGILLKNEMSYEDMVQIVEDVQAYVPIHSHEEQVHVHGRQEMTVTLDKFHYTLFGGDMLTAARARGSKKIVSNSERGKDRLEGVIPIVEDWHAKLCLLEVIWKRLYRLSSSKEGGTLYQLRNLINRRNVVKKPKKDVAACESYFELVVEAHILTAAMEVFHMSSTDGTPSSDLFPLGSSRLSKEQRHRILLSATKKVVDKFVDVSYPTTTTKENDHVRAYAREVLTLGLLFLEFRDAIREGDGLRILRCWRYFLPLFKATNRTNYSIEAFTMLAQYHFLLSPRLKHQLIWSRTINTTGKPGKNIPCDLHMEHINRECKQAMGMLGPNVSREKSVVRIGKSIGSVASITAAFDKEAGVRKDAGRHSKRSKAKDMAKILKQLKESQVFHATKKKRKHKSFKNFQMNCTRSVKVEDLNGWMNTQLEKLLTQQ